MECSRLKVSTTDNIILIIFELPQKEHIDWTKVFSIQVEEKTFVVRKKQSGKERTEYSDGLMLLTFSVIFQLTWRYKGWRIQRMENNKFCGIFILAQFVIVMKTGKRIFVFPIFSWW